MPVTDIQKRRKSSPVFHAADARQGRFSHVILQLCACHVRQLPPRCLLLLTTHLKPFQLLCKGRSTHTQFVAAMIYSALPSGCLPALLGLRYIQLCLPVAFLLFLAKIQSLQLLCRTKQTRRTGVKGAHRIHVAGFLLVE